MVRLFLLPNSKEYMSKYKFNSLLAGIIIFTLIICAIGVITFPIFGRQASSTKIGNMNKQDSNLNTEEFPKSNQQVNPKNIVSLPTGCSIASGITTSFIDNSKNWSAKVGSPIENQTMSGLMMGIPLKQGKPNVGYTSDIVKLLDISKINQPLSEQTFKKLFSGSIIPELNNNGYKLLWENSAAKQSVENPGTYSAPIGMEYIFTNENQIFSVHINSETTDHAKIDYWCANDIGSEREVYEKLLTYTGFNNEKITQIELWEMKDKVYKINILEGLSGHSIYLTLIDDNWIKLYEGQDTPECGLIESYKVGKGLLCSDVKTFTTREVK